MSIYEIIPALDLTQTVHAKISIGMHRGVKFKISRIPLIGLETRSGRRTDRTFLRNPNLNEITQPPAPPPPPEIYVHSLSMLDYSPTPK